VGEKTAEQARERRIRGVVRDVGERFFIPRARLLAVPTSRAAEVRAQVRRAEATASTALRAPAPLDARLSRAAIRELLLIVAGLRNIDRPEPEALQEAAAWVLADLRAPELRDGLKAYLDGDAAAPPPVSTLVAVASHLAALVDTRTPRELALKRATLLVALVLCAGFGIKLAFRARNFALGRTVTASSTCPYTPPAPYRSKRLGRAVDGVRDEKTFAVCTNKEVRPWIQVDLAKVRTVSDVVVYPRTECCFGQADLPLSVEISKDDKKYTPIGTTKVPFTSDSPWTVEAGNRQARYVRLTTKTPEARSIVISEIEVHGR